MNIIIFSKESRDAHGEYGPHVWWYQEEVNPRRRERYLVSAHLPRLVGTRLNTRSPPF